MHIRNLLLLSSALVVTGCSYSDSALQYATEGSKRVEAGYTAKMEMTKHLTAFLAEANKGCGVKVEIVNGVPVTTVKECIRLSDAMASVDKVEIVKPQQVKDILDSAGDFAMKATNLVVPTASIYYGYKNNEVNQAASVAIRQSDNQAQSSMWANYTSNYQNTSVTDKSVSVDKSVTDTSATTTTSTTTDTSVTTMPNVSVDGNTTTITK